MYNNVPVNGWPQIKDLEKLDALAKSIENMPTFTSNDKAFLEELPAFPVADGKKVLTATTSEGATALAYEKIPDELPEDPQTDGRKVLTATTNEGSTILSWEELEEAGETYSATPVKIGTWIGADLYRKVVDTGALTNNVDKAIASGLTNENVVRMYGFAKDANGVTLPIPYGDGVAVLSPYYDPATHTINYVIKSNLSGYTSSYCVLEYTQTQP